MGTSPLAVIHSERKLVFNITAVLVILGAGYDAFFYWEPEFLAYKWSNGILFGLAVLFYGLYWLKRANLSLSIAIIIYGTLANIIFIFLMNRIPGDFMLHMMRNAFFIPLLLITLGMVAGRWHVFVFGSVYYFFLVFLAFKTNHLYLQQNLGFFFIVISGTVAGLFLFLSQLTRSLADNAQVKAHNALMQQKLFEALEHAELVEGFKNRMIDRLENTAQKSLDTFKTSLEFIVRNEEVLSPEVRSRYGEVLLNAVDATGISLQTMVQQGSLPYEELEFKPEWLELSVLFSSAVQQVASAASKKGIALKHRKASLPVFVDYLTFTAVLRKVLTLVINCSKKGRKVSINYHQESKDTLIIVEGEGDAKQLDYMQRVFRGGLMYETDKPSDCQAHPMIFQFCKKWSTKNGGRLTYDYHSGESFAFKLLLPDTH
ncbi:MAG: hypothetical protein AB7S69_02840 [Salinivirgaceae bacterium]